MSGSDITKYSTESSVSTQSRPVGCAVRTKWLRLLTLAFSTALLFGTEFAQVKANSENENSADSAATPQEWANAFAAATQALEVRKIVALASNRTTVFFDDGRAQRTANNTQHKKELDEFYSRFKAEGKNIAAVDYSINQLSNKFALVRFTWEVTQSEQGKLPSRMNSSYLLRSEASGWRFVGVIEHGAPEGP